MRKIFRRYLPDHSAIHDNRWLAPFRSTLLHPRLWHLNRRSAAGGVAVGLFCGLVPGPFQIISAALFAVLFRVNLPLAIVLTIYTNPLTIIPLYMLAFEIGQWLLQTQEKFVPPPEFSDTGLLTWFSELTAWVLSLGKPLALGLLVLAIALAMLGYGVVRLSWRLHLLRAKAQRIKQSV